MVPLAVLVRRPRPSAVHALPRPWRLSPTWPASASPPPSLPPRTGRGRRPKLQRRPALEVESLLQGARVPPMWSSLQRGKEDEEVLVAFPAAGDLLDNLRPVSCWTTSDPRAAAGGHSVPLPSETYPTYSCPTVRVWQGNEDENYSCIHIFNDHTAEVEAVTVHASQKYFVTTSRDNSWRFYDISTQSCLTQVGEDSGKEGYTSAAFHPDGLILGTGTTDAVVKIWDVKAQLTVASFGGHVGPVTAMSFSENGYLLATAALDGVKVWDIRKYGNFRTLSPYNSDTPTNAVVFDFSGSYLAIGGSDIRVYKVASDFMDWNVFMALPDLSGTGKVTSMKFGADAKYIAVGSMDQNLRIFGLQSYQPSTLDKNVFC